MPTHIKHLGKYSPSSGEKIIISKYFISTALLLTLGITTGASPHLALPLSSTATPDNTPLQPRDLPFHIFSCETQNFTSPCYYLSSPSGVCWTPSGQPLNDTEGHMRIFGYNAPPFMGGPVQALSPSSGVIASFGPDAGCVCRLYNQPNCLGGVGDSIVTMKPGYAVLDGSVAGWPFASWKCIDILAEGNGACVWD